MVLIARKQAVPAAKGTLTVRDSVCCRPHQLEGLTLPTNKLCVFHRDVGRVSAGWEGEKWGGRMGGIRLWEGEGVAPVTSNTLPGPNAAA